MGSKDEKRKTSWPLMEKENNHTKCQSIYWNLICAVEAREGLGTLIIKEMRHTIRCDHVHDLMPLRISLEKEMSSAILNQVLTGNYVSKNPDAAESAVYHYNSYLRKELYESLDNSGKFYYNTKFHYDKVMASLGFSSGLLTIALAMSKAKKNKN